MYAVIEDGSRQYQVREGDRIEIDYRDVPVGERIEFTRVLLYSDRGGTRVGSPVVEDAKVVAEVIGQVKGEKIYVQKFRRREKYRRRTGHRQRYTRVLIREILAGTGEPPGEATEATERSEVEPEAELQHQSTPASTPDQQSAGDQTPHGEPIPPDTVAQSPAAEPDRTAEE